MIFDNNMIAKLENIDFNKKTGEVVLTDGAWFCALTIYFSEIPVDIKVGSMIEFEIRRSARGNKYGTFIRQVQSNQKNFAVEDDIALYEWSPSNQELFKTGENLELYEWGEQVKTNFVEKVAPNLGLDLAFFNPANRESGKINLKNQKNNMQGDIQVQETPFFTSGRHPYGSKAYDPSYTVTLNKKHYENYAKICSASNADFDIYYLVKWKELSYETEYDKITVEEVQGIWVTSFTKIRKVVESEKAYLHEYRYGRGEETYLLNLKDKDVFTRYL